MRWHSILLALPVAAACAAGDEPRHATVRDSAGVRIVENDVAPGTLPAFVIGEEAVVEIGVVEGEEAYQLDNVRRARWLSDGSIAVVNGGTSEVRLFNEDGTYVRTYGRRGGGPGEHSFPMDLWQYGDSLVVFDMGRITVVSLADGSARVIGPAALPDARPYYTEAWFGSDGVIMPIQDGHPTEVGSWTETSVDYVRIPLAGSGADTIVRVRSGLQGMIPFRTAAGRQAVLSTPPLFGGRARAAAYGGLLYAGTSLERRIGVYEATGTHIRDIRWTSPGHPVTPDRIDAYIARLIETSGSSEGVREGVEQMMPADTFPHFDGLLTDGSGRLWVRRFDLPGDTTPPRWTVFDTAGVAEAIVEMPSGLTVYEIRDDRVLGRRADDLGVQRVVVLPLSPRQPR